MTWLYLIQFSWIYIALYFLVPHFVPHFVAHFFLVPHVPHFGVQSQVFSVKSAEIGALRTIYCILILRFWSRGSEDIIFYS